MNSTATRAVTAAAALLLAAGTAISLTGCSTLTGVISPEEARTQAPKDSGATGPVDCRRAKCVALTFDGGPSEPTPKLLDILRREKVPATFFLQGKGHTDTFPDTVRRMADEGHEIANHTRTHENLTGLTEDEVRAEIAPVQEEIKKITGRAPTLMRPPGGATNDDLKKIMKDLGLAQILWSVTAKDYETTDTELIKQRVLDQTKRDGIILLHERYSGTIPAVPDIIAQLRQQGYEFVTVSQLMAPAKPRPGEVYRP
ncbi:peptidoglycan/xylan/chitin deacetylase (PgdA/CDA1 family) [Streptomyces sp. 2333.5]|uniref:polysaccharide deacetylase family protein n=1 Tax=unclassified Streptomyces TaxID=2593676 RepID=UPI00089B4C83|nr:MULTISPECIES: polysaccharide deacetylase family protein [unclassified Streptomyces]PJJ02961.1 peptidoglycan/xylan/chitin deacetylase (PgdA/CDA1 family) [Streptomyces sp. 2333.5]SED65937.1 Peptidoglycan/xylan/chitin deacetylase, PgdA/CDA1 family [Streptomyces sp. 2314.4]SEE23456.1 Peptidoglycan/xylan/chitin deacetylase, PgdA/CDA1 family [Streptomyces sp. 2112.2]